MQKSKLGRAVRSLALVAVAIPVLSANSCADKVTGGNDASGAYTFASIEQQGSAKCTISSSGCTVQNTGNDVVVIKSGVLNLHSDNTFQMSATGTKNGTSQVIGAVAGTWAQTQSGVTFTVPGVPVPIPAGWTSANRDALAFVLPAQTFSATQGSATVTFNKN